MRGRRKEQGPSLRPDREGRGVGPERARPQARSLWLPDRVRDAACTPRGRCGPVPAQAQCRGSTAVFPLISGAAVRTVREFLCSGFAGDVTLRLLAQRRV